MEKQSMKKRIEEKIEEIERFVYELYTHIPHGIDFEDYRMDTAKKAISERYFEKIIEAIEDLCFLIINYKKLRYPDYEKEVFFILSEKKIISDILAKKLSDAKGMRNVITHQYGKIDDERVFLAVTEELEKDVNDFLDSLRRSLK